MIVFGALDALDRRQLATAIDMLARRLRSDGLRLTPNVARILDLVTAPDPNRPEPTILDGRGEAPDDALVLLDLDEVADRLRVHRRTVERAAADGRLATVTIGRARRVRPDALADFIADTSASPGAPAGGSRDLLVPAGAPTERNP